MDCGPAYILIIARHYGRVLSLANLSSKSFTSREGSSILGLSDIKVELFMLE